MAATDTHDFNEDWLQDFFLERLRAKYCFRSYCNICTYEFMKELYKALGKRLGLEISRREEVPGLVPGGEGAVALLQGLAHVHPIEDATTTFDHPERQEVGIRYLVLRVWWITGEEKSEPEMERALAGSWAGEVLTRMQAHHKVRTAERRAWEEYHDPATVQLRREEKRRPKQERHAKRLLQQKERAREWHAKHRKDDS